MRRRYPEVFVPALVSMGLLGCSLEPGSSSDCELGYSKASSGNFQEALPLITRCLDSKNIDVETRRQAFLARAWTHSNLLNSEAAVTDQESAFQISPAADYREFINYASYLRFVNRVRDSLAPLKSAEALEMASGQPSMMTQYNLGWSLQELGQHDEAVTVFSRGIPVQPDYAFVYYRRGISLDALARKAEAKADFQKAADLLKSTDTESTSGKILLPMREKFREYGIE